MRDADGLEEARKARATSEQRLKNAQRERKDAQRMITRIRLLKNMITTTSDQEVPRLWQWT